MQRMNLHHVSHNPYPQVWMRSKTRLLEIALLLIAVALLAAFALPGSSGATNLIALLDNSSQSTRETGLGGSSSGQVKLPDRTDGLAVFEQNARQLTRTGSHEALQTLVQTLQQSEPASHRDITIALLKDASPKVVSVLLDALNDPDPGVRAGAAQVLGLRRENQAIAALTVATHDFKARVRTEAVKSLGGLYAWQALPRLELLRASEGYASVLDAVDSATAEITAQIAKEIGVSDGEVVSVSVTTSDLPQIYVATKSDLYVRNGITWNRISQLPDSPIAIATGSDENLVYLSTIHAGLYRSPDGGATWQHVQFGLQTPTQLTVTAIVVDSRNSQQLYAALASPGAHPGKLDPLGIYSSPDGGHTWTRLEDSSMYGITTHLALDRSQPDVLFGIADDTQWRYQLPSEF